MTIQNIAARSLTNLEIVGCKSTAAAHFSPSFCPIAQLLGCKSGKNCARWGRFSLSTLQVRQAPGAHPISATGRFHSNSHAPRWLVAAGALLLTLAAQATTLTEAWQAAEQHDRPLAVARAAHGVAEPRRAQADALWRPSVVLNASAGLGASDSTMRDAQFSAPGLGTSSGVDFSTSITGGAATRVALQASQPIYNEERRAQQEQLRLQADQGDLQWEGARQQALLRVAQHYLHLALAQEQVRVLTAQSEALQHAATEAADRFEIGSASITAVHEARAQLAGVQARIALAKADLEIKRRALADATGLPEPGLSASLPARAATDARSLAVWQQLAETTSPQLREQRLAVDLAEAELRKRAARWNGATVDLIAQAEHQRLAGHGDFGSARNAGLNAMVGVQLTLPLTTGGMRGAREQEAAAQLASAQASLDAAREQLARDIHGAWLALRTGTEQVSALQAALEASRLREDATRTGFDAGERTSLDVLNARNDQAATRLQLAQALSATLLARLRLALLAGQIGETDLREADALLAEELQNK